MMWLGLLFLVGMADGNPTNSLDFGPYSASLTEEQKNSVHELLSPLLPVNTGVSDGDLGSSAETPLLGEVLLRRGGDLEVFAKAVARLERRTHGKAKAVVLEKLFQRLLDALRVQVISTYKKEMQVTESALHKAKDDYKAKLSACSTRSKKNRGVSAKAEADAKARGAAKASAARASADKGKPKSTTKAKGATDAKAKQDTKKKRLPGHLWKKAQKRSKAYCKNNWGYFNPKIMKWDINTWSDPIATGFGGLSNGAERYFHSPVSEAHHSDHTHFPFL